MGTVHTPGTICGRDGCGQHHTAASAAALNAPHPGEIQVVIPTWWRPTFDAAVLMLGLELYAIPSRADDLPTYGVRFTDAVITAKLQTLQERRDAAAHLWPCGCLPNEAGAHRGACPAYCQGCRRVGSQLPNLGWVIVHVPGCAASSEVTP